MNQFEQKCTQIKYQYMGILPNSNYFSLKLIFRNSTYNSNSFSLYSPPLAIMTKLSSFHMNFNLMEHLGKSSLKSGFFLKATLWPDFTELFFRFFGLNRWWFSPVNFGCFWCQKRRFLSCLVTLSDQLTKAQKAL